LLHHDHVVDEVRRFNRFYTKHIGALNKGLLESPYSLTEARVLYELATRESASDLGLDPGYLSRILARFQKAGLVNRGRSRDDRRRLTVELTEEGRAAFEVLNRRSHEQTAAMLDRLAEPERDRLLRAMRTIEAVLEPQAGELALRDPRPGDLGWIVHRQTVLYAEEYGWNAEYETLIAGIVSTKFERCWVADIAGRVMGSVFLFAGEGGAARLRLLYVEPECRGKGVGRRLVRECVRCAQESGYSSITLWTQSILAGARRIYEAEGFALVSSEPHHSFGKDLIGETWTLEF
jgi:DNA-binding MarR family transcriptional regulator/GNAT superfamily N-acetyltransferase